MSTSVYCHGKIGKVDSAFLRMNAKYDKWFKIKEIRKIKMRKYEDKSTDNSKKRARAQLSCSSSDDDHIISTLNSLKSAAKKNISKGRKNILNAN